MIKLITKRLILRPFEKTDIDELFEIIQDENVKAFLPGLYTTSKKELKKTLDIYVKGDFKNDIYLAITEKSTGKVIGGIVLVRVCTTNMEISYFLAKEKREMGLMLEAVSAFMHWYAKSGITDTIFFAVSKFNNASLRLCAKMREIKLPIFSVAESNTEIYYVIRALCLNYW